MTKEENKKSKKKIKDVRAKTLDYIESLPIKLSNMLFICFLWLKLNNSIDWAWIIIFVPLMASVFFVYAIKRREQRYIYQMAQEEYDGKKSFEESLTEELEEILNKNEEL